MIQEIKQPEPRAKRLAAIHGVRPSSQAVTKRTASQIRVLLLILEESEEDRKTVSGVLLEDIYRTISRHRFWGSKPFPSSAVRRLLGLAVEAEFLAVVRPWTIESRAWEIQINWAKILEHSSAGEDAAESEVAE